MSEGAAAEKLASPPAPAPPKVEKPGEVIPVDPSELEVFKPAPGELYYIKPWQTALIFIVAFLLHVPFLVDERFQQSYPVLKKGAVVITGASTGIGKDTAVFLAGKNYTVFAGVRSKDQVNKLKAENIANLTPVLLDVSKEKDVDNAFKEISKALEQAGTPLAAVINNAGISAEVAAEFHDLKEARSLFDVNFFGALKVTQKFLPLLRKSKGRIINISSVLGQLTVPEMSIYAASKHALEALSDGLRRELLPLNVSVSIIEPGYVKSAIHGKIEDSGKKVEADVAAAYPHLTAPHRAEDTKRFVAKAAPAKVVYDAVYDAMTSAHPKARYAVAGVDDWPAGALTWIARVAPDRVIDWLLLRDN